MMRLGVQAKLFLISILLMVVVGSASGVFLEAQLRAWLGQIPAAQVEGAVSELRLLVVLAGLFGLAVAIFMSWLASRVLLRTVQAAAQPHADATEAREFDAVDTVVRKLAAERGLFRTLLEGLDEAVLALDDTTNVLAVNRSAREMFQVGPSALGRPLALTTREPGILDAVAQAQETLAATSAEVEIRRPVERQVFVRASPLDTGGFVVVVRDLTTLRRLERVRRDFVANVSHELRTPVSVIRANAETLLEGPAQQWPKPERRFMEAISRNADRLTDLIGDLMDIARVEAGTFRLTLEDVSAVSALRQACDTLASRAEARDVTLSFDAAAELTVRADARALDQVLLNLVENSVKYGNQGGAVEVRARASGERVRFEVEDDGPGIEPRHRGRIFERFYRVDAGRAKQAGGTGLGLAIVKHLVLTMGGEVGIEDGENGGSLFWFELPST